jgi:hypothetical protein
MTVPEEDRQRNIEYRYHPSRERFWLIGLLLTAVIFLAVAAFVVMSGPAGA